MHVDMHAEHQSQVLCLWLDSKMSTLTFSEQVEGVAKFGGRFELNFVAAGSVEECLRAPFIDKIDTFTYQVSMHEIQRTNVFVSVLHLSLCLDVIGF